MRQTLPTWVDIYFPGLYFAGLYFPGPSLRPVLWEAAGERKIGMSCAVHHCCFTLEYNIRYFTLIDHAQKPAVLTEWYSRGGFFFFFFYMMLIICKQWLFILLSTNAVGFNFKMAFKWLQKPICTSFYQTFSQFCLDTVGDGAWVGWGVSNRTSSTDWCWGVAICTWLPQ